MCAISMILDHGRHQLPKIDKWPLQPQYDYWKQYMELVDQAKEYDRKAKQPNCEDPIKADILNKILTKLEELEKKIEAK